MLGITIEDLKCYLKKCTALSMFSAIFIIGVIIYLIAWVSGKLFSDNWINILLFTILIVTTDILTIMLVYKNKCNCHTEESLKIMYNNFDELDDTQQKELLYLLYGLKNKKCCIRNKKVTNCNKYFDTMETDIKKDEYKKFDLQYRPINTEGNTEGNTEENTKRQKEQKEQLDNLFNDSKCNDNKK